MDVQEFWEENKRWVLLCALGGVIYLVASSVIASMYDPGPVLGQMRTLTARLTNEERYGALALSAAQAEGEELDREVARLREALEFRPSSAYVLDGIRPADLQLFSAQENLIQKLEEFADTHIVELQRRNLNWETPVSTEDIRETLVGLAMLDEAVSRLFQSHIRVREEDETSIGLTALHALRLDRRSNSGRGAPRPAFNRRRAVDPSRFLGEVTMTFHFEADSATVLLWLEALRGGGNPLALVDLDISIPRRDGDPMTVKGVLAAVTFDEEEYLRALDEAGMGGT